MPTPPGVRVVLWHSQRGAEQDVLLELLRRFNAANAGRVYVEPLAVPDGTFKDKLLRTVPRGAGPDLADGLRVQRILDACRDSDRTGCWVETPRGDP